MKLFEPITIRGLTLKNRIIFPPMGFGGNRQGTRLSERIMEFWANVAKGGAGAVIMGGISPASLIVYEDLCLQESPVMYFDDLRRMVEMAHQAGSKLGVQLWHTNLYPSSLTSPFSAREEWVAPSPRIYRPEEGSLIYLPKGENLPMRELTSREIEAIVSRFARASARVKQAGVDFVELHLAHGHLPNQFFSPITNRRSDEYGGDLPGRMRFGLECMRAIRTAVGKSYPVFVRFPAEDEEGAGGATLAESIMFAMELEKAGADCLDVSVGLLGKTPYRSHVCPTKKDPMGTFAHLAEAIKQRVTISVVAVGRINTPEVSETILQKGQADLVAIGRQLVCDPYWPEKVANDRFEDVLACDSCNTYCWFVGPKGLPPDRLCHKRDAFGSGSLAY